MAAFNIDVILRKKTGFDDSAFDTACDDLIDANFRQVTITHYSGTGFNLGYVLLFCRIDQATNSEEKSIAYCYERIRTILYTTYVYPDTFDMVTIYKR